MKLEIVHPNKDRRSLDLDTPVLTIGRDPTCDLVLDDPKCSRRHAILREGPDGLSIRDSDSVNGLVVNGQRVKRTPLTVGDEIRIGSVVLRITGARTPDGAIGATVIGARTVLGAPLAQIDVSEPVTPTTRSIFLPEARGLRTPFVATLTLLSVVTGIAALFFIPLVVSICDLLGLPSFCRVLGACSLLAVAGCSLLLGYGLWRGAPWARNLQTTLAAAGLASCILTPSALIVLIYSLRTGARHDTPEDGMASRRTEALFLGGLLLSLAASSVITLLALTVYGRPWLQQRRQDHAIRVVASRLTAMADAQEQFRRVCNTGYADLDSLLAPASVIPGYPAGGASFVPPAFARNEERGYRYVLSVFDPIAPAPDCPIRRRFRRYSYAAQPLAGKGYHFVVGPGRLVYLALDRPATTNDPVVP
jgi:hypothetical protein